VHRFALVESHLGCRLKNLPCFRWGWDLIVAKQETGKETRWRGVGVEEESGEWNIIRGRCYCIFARWYLVAQNFKTYPPSHRAPRYERPSMVFPASRNHAVHPKS
jgi:hypothetical protein